MATEKLCDKCKTEVKRFDTECPSCSGTSFSFTYNDKPASESSDTYKSDTPIDFSRTNYSQSLSIEGSNKSNNSYSSSETTIADLVRAQNRTTHAVRAFVRFLFIQLSAVTLAIFFWNIGVQLSGSFECSQNGNCGPSTFWFVTAGITWLVGLAWSSAAGWEELHKSEL